MRLASEWPLARLVAASGAVAPWYSSRAPLLRSPLTSRAISIDVARSFATQSK
jgi:hypothetical protein